MVSTRRLAAADASRRSLGSGSAVRSMTALDDASPGSFLLPVRLGLPGLLTLFPLPPLPRPLDFDDLDDFDDLPAPDPDPGMTSPVHIGKI